MFYNFIYKPPHEPSLETLTIRTIDADSIEAAISIFMSDDALDQHLIYKIIKHARRDVYVHDDVYILLNDIPEKSFKDMNTLEKYSDFLYENGGYINEMLYLLG